MERRRDRLRTSGGLAARDRAVGADPVKEKAKEGGTDARLPLAEPGKDPVHKTVPVEELLATAKATPQERIDSETPPDSGRVGIKRPFLFPPKSMVFLIGVPKEGPSPFDLNGERLEFRGEAPLDPAVIKKLLAQGAEISDIDIKHALAQKFATGRPEKETDLEHQKQQAAIKEAALRNRKGVLDPYPDSLGLKPRSEKIPWWKKGPPLEEP